MNKDVAGHWQAVYAAKQIDEVSWYAPRLSTSLRLIEKAGVHPGSRVIDIGCGASTLIDDLLDGGLRDITALDISAAALDATRRRLGTRAVGVDWRVMDARRLELPAESVDLWHDRAALHFLTEPDDVLSYVAAAHAAIVKNGHAVIGGFAADGPTHCSGLPVTRRDPEQIEALFGPAFALRESVREVHCTPRGNAQAFAYVLLRRTG